jgi:hypothetical protein
MPRRTPAQTRRRRDLADSASGFTRAKVILYAYVPAGQDPEPVRNALHQYAYARDWDTPHTLIDQEPDRPGWVQARHLVAAGEAQGIVTPPHTLDDQAHDWLRDHQAFLAETGPIGEEMSWPK